MQLRCRTHARTVREPYGIWGGLSAEDREQLLHPTRTASTTVTDMSESQLVAPRSAGGAVVSAGSPEPERDPDLAPAPHATAPGQRQGPSRSRQTGPGL